MVRQADTSLLFSTNPFGDTDEEPSTSAITAPSTLASTGDAVEAAKENFSNLIVLDSAVAGARKSPFQRPQEIYDALKDFDEVARDWSRRRTETGSGGDILLDLKNRGWGRRVSAHISDTTRTRYGDDYTFDYKGQKLLFEPHITLGAGDANTCASIHFWLDQASGKIVVGHVGRHLRNTKT